MDDQTDGLYNKRLYGTNITKVVVINTLTGNIESTISIAGSKALNDIEFHKKGRMYVSDPELGYVYRIVNGKPELYLQALKAANGLKVVNNSLYILTDSALLKVMPSKKMVSLAKMEPGGDGVQPIGNGDFILSRFQGVMYNLQKNSALQSLLDTRGQKKAPPTSITTWHGAR